jgi:hypothetical protein
MGSASDCGPHSSCRPGRGPRSRLHPFGGARMVHPCKETAGVGREGMHTTMRRIRAMLAGSWGLTLAACSSFSLPSFDFPGFQSAPATQTLRFESEPPGAEARISQGMACRTPCALAVPVTEMAVTFALNGYHPQTVAVHVRQVEIERDPELVPTSDPKLTPNPVAVALEPAPPPAPVRRRSSPPPRQPRPQAQPAAPAVTPAPVSPFPSAPPFPPR